MRGGASTGCQVFHLGLIKVQGSSRYHAATKIYDDRVAERLPRKRPRDSGDHGAVDDRPNRDLRRRPRARDRRLDLKHVPGRDRRRCDHRGAKLDVRDSVLRLDETTINEAELLTILT